MFIQDILSLKCFLLTPDEGISIIFVTLSAKIDYLSVSSTFSECSVSFCLSL